MQDVLINALSTVMATTQPDCPAIACPAASSARLMAG
jgi:hypothetical protein